MDLDRPPQVHGAQLHLFVLVQPPGQTAELQLGAHVGPDAEEHKEFIFLGEPKEFREIILAAEVESTI